MLTRHKRLKNYIIPHKCGRILGGTHYMALLRSALRWLVVNHNQVSGPLEVSDVAAFPVMV